MGYYTDFKLATDTGLEDDKDFAEYFEEVTGYEFDGTDFNHKWYDHRKNMKKISEHYPEVKFTLEGSGEEAGDMWIAYYLNGKEQMCKSIVTFEERTLW
jgi:hypothetical protein